MKSHKLIYLAGGIILALGSCSKEAQFEAPSIDEGEGRMLTSALNLSVKESTITRSRAIPSENDFKIHFYKKGENQNAVKSFNYGDMPEIVSLPAGNYTVKAVYGGEYANGGTAQFEAPHYLGESKEFTVESGKIVDTIDPILCTLENVRVNISFDPELKAVMGSDVKVTVYVGEAGNDTLDFYPESEDEGYFQYSDNSTTLVAIFSGEVQGTHITENKTYNNVRKGNYYKINFKLHRIDPDSSDPGSIEGENGMVFVDATLVSQDLSDTNGNLNPDEEYLEDDRYQDENGDDEPQNPQDPDNTEKPVITSDDVDINAETDISGWDSSLVVKILTSSTISEFKCRINSSTLTPKELEQVGLVDNLDLVNDIYEKEPGEDESIIWQKLRGLGFPVGEDVTNPQEMENGKYVIKFDITTFAPLLNALGPGSHQFIFTVTNEAGTTVKTLKLRS